MQFACYAGIILWLWAALFFSEGTLLQLKAEELYLKGIMAQWQDCNVEEGSLGTWQHSRQCALEEEGNWLCIFNQKNRILLQLKFQNCSEHLPWWFFFEACLLQAVSHPPARHRAYHLQKPQKVCCLQPIQGEWVGGQMLHKCMGNIRLQFLNILPSLRTPYKLWSLVCVLTSICPRKKTGNHIWGNLLSGVKTMNKAIYLCKTEAEK